VLEKKIMAGVVDKCRSVRTMSRVDRNTSAWDVDGDEDRMTNSRKLLSGATNIANGLRRSAIKCREMIAVTRSWDNVSRGSLLTRQVAVPPQIL
jgi:hypothetical protein